MKIALITSMKYGMTQFIFRDIEALVNKGHEVKIFTLHYEPGLYKPLPEWEVIPISRWRMVWRNLWFLLCHPLLYLRLLGTALRTRSFINLAMAIDIVDQVRGSDVMYAYFGDHKLFIGYYCKLITGIPLAVTIRAYELYRNPNPALFAEVLQQCDRIVSITEYNKAQLVERFGAPEQKIDIVRQIVDLEAFQYRPKIKILIVGFFAEKKGHEILFRAVKQMKREDVEIWVVGDKNITVVGVNCRRLVKELGIEAQVAFFGEQTGNALRALYNECDIFCLPSRPDRYGDKEGFPNVIAEAMAFGKPVVSTRHAGIPEAVERILVEENNVEQLAEALHMACDSAELRRSLGDANRRRAEAMFSPANNDTLVDILKKCVQRPTSAQVGSGAAAAVAGDNLATRLR